MVEAFAESSSLKGGTRSVIDSSQSKCHHTTNSIGNP